MNEIKGRCLCRDRGSRERGDEGLDFAARKRIMIAVAARNGGVGAVAGAVALFFSLIAVAQPVAPVPAPLFLTTLRDISVTVTLAATDDDMLALTDLTAHPLLFNIVSGPTNGDLAGDLRDVVYAAPNKALVTLTYTPRAGFVGTDTFIYSVTDPFGFFATATVRIEVARPPGPPPTLSGAWDLSTTFDSVPAGISALSAGLTLFYTVDVFRFEMVSAWSLAGWTSLQLAAAFPLGTAALVRSTLSFNPMGPSFTYWQVDTRVASAGLDFTHTLYLTGVPASSYARLVARGRVDSISFTSTVKFGLLDVEFRELLLTTRFTWPTGKLDVNTEFRVLKTGFDYFSFALSKIPIPGLVQPHFGVFIELTTKFTTQTKEVFLEFLVESDWDYCVKLLAEVVSSGATLTGLNVYGFEIRTSFTGGIEFWAATSLDPTKNSSVTGYSNYFEVWMLTGPILPCCGAPGRWQIATYFDNTAVSLFSWGQTRITLDFALNEFVRGLTEFTVQNTSPTWELKVGLKVRW